MGLLQVALKSFQVQGFTAKQLQQAPPAITRPLRVHISDFQASLVRAMGWHREHIAQSDHWCAFLLSLNQPVPPALLLDAGAIVYTDGSKFGASITAAWVHPASQRSYACRLEGESSPQRTALRGELVAIYSALHSRHFLMHEPIHIMTDSKTSL